MLPWFLNDQKNAAQRSRVLALLEKLRELDTLYSAEREAPTTERIGFLDTAFITPPPEAAALQAEINAMLAKYQTKPVISGATEHAPGLLILPQPAKQEPESTDWRVTEAHAVEMLVSMAETGMLDRVRQCEWCKRWFVASRSDRRFCKEPCKRKHQSSSPEFKAQRAEYMRKRYELLKTGRFDKSLQHNKQSKENGNQ